MINHSSEKQIMCVKRYRTIRFYCNRFVRISGKKKVDTLGISYSGYISSIRENINMLRIKIDGFMCVGV